MLGELVKAIVVLVAISFLLTTALGIALCIKIWREDDGEY